MSDTKELVLEYLEKNKNRFLSGETIAENLGLSRNSVWKAIESLRRSGYQIKAVTNKGYQLITDQDLISLPEITRHLEKGIHPEYIHVYNTIESTSKTAKGAAAYDAPSGTVIIASTQTLGSGRKKRAFYSPTGGIYMSIVLSPDKLPFENKNLITAYACVCVCDAIEELTGISCKIKWGNDLYVGDKKVCGILTESASDHDTGDLSWIVVGIGINFKVNTDSFPKDIKGRAGSLFPPGEDSISKNLLIAEIINRILHGNNWDKASLTSSILTSYREKMLMLGHHITVIEKATTYPATATSIDDNGKLIITLPDGTTKTLRHEEISISL